jgi:BASS family bile acid:Na+ symporter
VDPKQVVLLVLQASILLTVFSLGLKTTTRDLTSLLQRPGLLARSLVAVFVVMPIVAVLLAGLFDFRHVVEVALVALAISPMPPILPRKEIKAGGALSYALGLMTVLALLAIVIVPLALLVLQQMFGRQLSMPPGTVARVVLMTTLVPLAVGVAVRAALPRPADTIQKPVAVVANILLGLAAVVLLVATARAQWALVGNGTLFAMIIFVAVGLAVGHTLGGPDPDHSVVLALSTACRHPGIGLSIAATNFPNEQFAGAIVLYVIVGTIVTLPYLSWLRRTRPAVAL